MKRILLFLSSFVIVVAAAAALWLGFAASVFERELFRAALGNPYAQHLTAHAYMTGTGVEKDEAVARHWYDRAMRNGREAAAFDLGLMLLRGQGGEKDEARACALFRAAAEKNYAPGQVSAARCAFLGLGGTEKSDTAGAEWVKKAAAANSSEAQALLGILYLGGIGVEQSHENAAAWLKKSQEQTAKDLAARLDAEAALIDVLPPEARAEKWAATYAAMEAGIRADFDRIVRRDTQP